MYGIALPKESLSLSLSMIIIQREQFSADAAAASQLRRVGH